MYAFAIQEQTNVVETGTIWLYHYSWYGLQKFRLAEIIMGRSSIHLSQERIDQDIRPHSNTDAYILVLEFPASGWYRTPDIAPQELFQTLLPALDALGQVASRSNGTKHLMLPAPVEHRIVLNDQDGQPIADTAIPVEIYVYDRDHCGAHFGIPLGTFTTSAHGEIQFTAPVVPLYLSIWYHQLAGPGIAGQMYKSHYGLSVSEDPEQEIQLIRRLLVESFLFHVEHQDGTPLANVRLEHCLLTAECGANCGSLWKTDRDGNVRAAFAPQTLQRLSFHSNTGIKYLLSDEELATLMAKKSLTVIWSR